MSAPSLLSTVRLSPHAKLAKRANTIFLIKRNSSTQASPNPPHLDFRAFVDALRQDGDLADIKTEVDPHLELAAITRRAYERRSKAPLFHNVKGAQSNGGLFRILGGEAGLSSDPRFLYRRLARHLGLPSDAGLRDVMDRMLEAKDKPGIGPVRVEKGVCQEVVIRGDDVDLRTLPVPRLNKADGGDYIQTMGINVVRNPEGNWVNWSIARAMIHDKTHMTGLIMKPQHIARIFSQYKSLNSPPPTIPFAIALGAPPIATMAASMPLPAGCTESSYIGALCGSPLPLVQCLTNDLLVPANSEIILEGSISLTETGTEGPFGEMHGYSFLDERSQQPLYKVEAITHRKDPILSICVPGRAGQGPDETHTMIGTLAAAEMRQLLQESGLPVTDVHALYESQVIWAAVKVDRKGLKAMGTNAKELSEKIGNLVFRNKCGMQIHRLLLVGDDIDAYSWEDVMWAYATRCRPGMDEYLFEDVTAYPLVPYMSHGPGTKLTGGKVVSNCMLPMEYEGEQTWVTCDFENGYPEDVKQKVLKNWTSFALD